ncbi:MAG TPA: antibiotic biosynthesis monooxygenase family protein, partial [Sphingobacteriaceae bacterium]
MKKLFTIFALIALTTSFIGCKDKSEQPENLVVLVQYKTLPNKSIDAVTGLKNLIEEVKKEDHFIKIKLHVDQTDNSNILLYEEWDDEQYYKNQHMKTAHLKKF